MLRYTTLHYTTLTTLRYTTLHQLQLQLQLHYTTTGYTTLDYAAAHNTTAHYTTSHCTTLVTPHHNYKCNFTTLITRHTTTTPAAIHHTTSTSCGCNHCNHSKKHNSNHLSVHQWVRSAIHASQQLTSPIVSYPWNFRHRLVRYYW